VFFESPDGAFHGVAAMAVSWQQSAIYIIDGKK
jgi:hypothetical protein